MNEINESNEMSQAAVVNPEDRKWFSELGLRYLALTAAMLIVQLGVGNLILYLFKDQAWVKEYSIFINMLPMYIIGVPVGCFVISRQKATPVAKQTFTIKKLIACIAVAFGFMYVGNIVGSILSNMLATLTSTKANNAVADLLMGSSMWQNFIIAVICAPIIEEFIMRKLLIERTIKYGEKTAIIVSALAFGIYHGNITQFVYATLIGLVLGYVYVKSGNLIYNIIIHMVINFVGGILSMLVLKKTGLLELIEVSTDPSRANDMMSIIMNNLGGVAIYGVYVLCLIAVAIIGIIIFALNVKKLNLQAGEKTLAKGTIFKTIVLNVGVILFIIAWFAIAVFSLVAAQ